MSRRQRLYHLEVLQLFVANKWNISCMKLPTYIIYRSKMFWEIVSRKEAYNLWHKSRKFWKCQKYNLKMFEQMSEFKRKKIWKWQKVSKTRNWIFTYRGLVTHDTISMIKGFLIDFTDESWFYFMSCDQERTIQHGVSQKSYHVILNKHMASDSLPLSILSDRKVLIAGSNNS